MVDAVQPISTAPLDGRWVLVCDPSIKYPQSFHGPWVIASRSDQDSGWEDGEGNGVSPTLWVPLPDPQPALTDWTPPEGNIIVEKGQWTRVDTGEPIPGAAFTISVERSDGSCDSYGWREPSYAPTFDDAMAKARRLQERIGLPIIDRTSTILPFRPRPTSSPPSGPEAA
ncbi:MAG TPA: hypothetical protein VHL34_24935 [Rhizomicrobium sp.]|jgi:hypothetical protein|nr:hypothetical protein [Rhizomicrobium sp.]